MSVLQGFEEVNMTAPRGKLSMLVTKDVVRFNKATAIALGYPAYVKVLITTRPSNSQSNHASSPMPMP